MFYDFWFAFKSWRVFPHEDEEDVEQAEFREQRRWIERYVGGGCEHLSGVPRSIDVSSVEC